MLRERRLRRSFCFVITVLIISAGCSCNGTKNTSKQEKKEAEVSSEQQKSTGLETSFDVSPGTKIFINQIQKEMKNEDTGFEDYEPSDDVVEKYGLKYRDDTYTVSGFVKTTNTFKKDELESKGVSLGRERGGMMTVHIPLDLLPDFLKSNNITYFQISEQVELK